MRQGARPRKKTSGSRKGARLKKQATGNSEVLQKEELVEDIKFSRLYTRYLVEGDKSDVFSPSMSVEHVASGFGKLEVASSIKSKGYQGTIDECNIKNEFKELQEQSIDAKYEPTKKCGVSIPPQLGRLRRAHLGYIANMCKQLFDNNYANLVMCSNFLNIMSKVTAHSCLIETIITRSLVAQTLCAFGAYKACKVVLTNCLSPLDFYILNKTLSQFVRRVCNEKQHHYIACRNLLYLLFS